MARDITVQFEDGSSHIYAGAPDDATPEQVYTRASKDFSNKKVIHLDGGKSKSADDIVSEAGKFGNQLRGVGEAAGTMVAGIPSQIVGGLAGLGHLMAGSGLDKAADASNAIQQWNFGAGAFQPITNEGKALSDKVQGAFAKPGEIAGDVGAAIGKVLGNEELGRLSGKLPVDAAMNFLPIGFGIGGVKLTKGRGVKPTAIPDPIANLEQIRQERENTPPIDPGNRAMGDIVDSQTNGWTEPVRSNSTGNGMDTIVSQTDAMRQAEAQRVIDARKAAMEQEVARQTSLDQNAAERARQEQASTGYDQWVEQQRNSAEQRQPGNNAPMDFESPYPVDVTKYPDVLKDAPYQHDNLVDTTAHRIDDTVAPLEHELSRPLHERVLSILNGEGYSTQQRRGGKQSGALDKEIFKSAFRGINRHLSNLTDQPWVKQAFPASHFETNRDGTPKVLLHGTNVAFHDRPRIMENTGYEGLHAGYGSASTLKASLGVKEGRVGYRSGNLDFIPDPNKKSHNGKSSAMYPVVLKKGNYPKLNGDYGSWEPMKLADSRQFKLDLSKATGRGYYSIEDFMDSYKSNILNKQLSPKAENIIFSKMLKDELGVDGFTYPNTYENAQRNLTEKGISTKGKQYAKQLGLEDSVVTYDDKNMVSLYDKDSQATARSGGMGHGQSGKLAFSDIADTVSKGLENIGKRVKEIRAPVTDRERILRDVTRDNSFVLPGKSGEDIVALAKGEVDNPGLWTNFQSGLTSAGMKTKSTVMSETARWLSYANKIGEKNFRERVKPIEHVLSAISKPDLQVAMKVMTKEMFEKSLFTPEELTKAGVSKDAQLAMSKLRDAYATGIEAINATRRSLGIKELKPQEAYFSSQFGGDYHLPVLDANKKLIGYATAHTMGEAKKALKWIQENVPEAHKESLAIVDRRDTTALSKMPKDVSSLYQTMMEVFKDTPMEAELRQMLEGHNEVTGYASKGFYKHFEHKAGVRFFLGDRPWLNEHENAVQAAQSQVKYLKDLYSWIPTQEAMAQLKKVFSDETLLADQPHNVALSKAYADDFLGNTKSIFNKVEDVIGMRTGMSTGTMRKWVGSLKSMTYLQQLSLSPGYAIATPLQALFFGPSFHNMISQTGVKHNPIITAAKTLGDLKIILAHALDTHLDVNISDKLLSPIAKDAMRYMEDNGIITKSLMDEFAGLGQHKAVDAAKQTLGATITAPDKLTRIMTFMSFVHHLNDGGAKMSKMEMFQKAAELTDMTCVPIERHNRPLLVNKAGLAGELGFVYKAPVFMAYNNLMTLGHDARRTGNYTPLALAMGSMFLLGGLSNMPGVPELDSGFEMFKDLVGHVSKEAAVKLKDVGVKQTMMANLPDWATNGTLSAASGIQLASRFNNEAINLQHPLGSIAPIATEAREWASGGDAIVHHDLMGAQQAAYVNSPPLVKGLMENNLDNFNNGKRGKLQAMKNPNDLRANETRYLRDAQDTNLRNYGLTSMKEARNKDIDFRAGQDERRMTQIRPKIINDVFNSVLHQKDPEDSIKLFIDAGGTGEEFSREFDRKIAGYAMTPAQRELVKANTVREFQLIQRKLQMGRNYAN